MDVERKEISMNELAEKIDSLSAKFDLVLSEISKLDGTKGFTKNVAANLLAQFLIEGRL